MSFSKKEAFRFGWNTFKAQPWVYVGAGAILMAVSVIINMLTGDDRDMLAILIGIAGTLVQWWLYIGFLRMALGVYAGGVPNVNTLFGESWKTLVQYAIVAIITGVLTFIGVILLVVPGIIVFTMLVLAPFLLLDKGIGGIDALKESRRITKGHRMNIFLFALLIALLNIAGALVFFVGLLVTVPVSLLAFVYAYKQVEKGLAMEPAATPMPAASAPEAPAQA